MVSEANASSFRIISFGVVQGVGFRAYVRRIARQLGLKGYVRNLEDGSVEMLVIGPDDKVDKLIERIRLAPPPIHVTSLSVKKESSDVFYNDFIIKH